MTTKTFSIHPQLCADSHRLFSWRQCHLRLNKNASMPWLIVIPETNHIEFHDLPTDMQLDVALISRVSSHYFKADFRAEKINFAAIGNVVKQLHIHVIGRHANDPLWPDVVWGNDLPDKAYTHKELKKINADLLALLKLSP